MKPKYDFLNDGKDISKLPKVYIFENHRDCLYGLADVVISLKKNKFKQRDVHIVIKEDNLDGIEKLYFRRPKKRHLLRKRYVDEEMWKKALEQFAHQDYVYYSFKEQTKSRGNHSAGKCLIDFHITKPDESNKRKCVINMRASIVPYNLFFDLLLIHNMIDEFKTHTQTYDVGEILINVGLLTIKKAVSFTALICMGYHFDDLKHSNFFSNDINHLFDNQKHPSSYKVTRINWNNAYDEMMERLANGEDPKLWEWSPAKAIRHKNILKEESNNGK